MGLPLGGTITAPSLHRHCTSSLQHHCTLSTITAPSLHHHCTITAPSLHHHCTITALSPHHHHTIPAGIPLTQEQLDAFFLRYDTDGGGEVSYDEIIDRVCCSSGAGGFGQTTIKSTPWDTM